ncbi:MAG: hypothetical protein MUF61_02685 [archaeon]|jgi:hypothetical protein|nr:hypothetical protein [archaeon]
MIKKRFLGFTLFLFGLLLSLSKIALTGAVIGVSASSFISLIGALTMIGGLILLIGYGRSYRQRVEESLSLGERESRLKKMLERRGVDYTKLGGKEQITYMRAIGKYEERLKREEEYKSKHSAPLEPTQKIKDLLHKYSNTNLSPVLVAAQINGELKNKYGIARSVNYTGGDLNLSVRTKRRIVPLKVSTAEKAKDLAFAFRLGMESYEPKSRRDSELQISEEASSKHHPEGLEVLLNQFRAQHKQELKKAFPVAKRH